MKENIPSDLKIIDSARKGASYSDLENIIYTDWYHVVEPRIGVCLAISESKLDFPIGIKLPDLEDLGFSFKNCKIEKVPAHEKCWDDNEFYTDLTRKFKP